MSKSRILIVVVLLLVVVVLNRLKIDDLTEHIETLKKSEKERLEEAAAIFYWGGQVQDRLVELCLQRDSLDWLHGHQDHIRKLLGKHGHLPTPNKRTFPIMDSINVPQAKP